MKEIEYGLTDKRERVDKYLKDCLNLSRERVKSCLKSGLIIVNGRHVPPSYLLHGGDIIEILGELCSAAQTEIIPESFPLDIIYRDNHICVVNKPAGVITHPTGSIKEGTLVNFLLNYTALSSIGKPFRPGVVHRLDKETSGVIAFAVSDRAYWDLAKQFRNRETGKDYLAVVQGHFDKKIERAEFTVMPSRKASNKMDVHYFRGRQMLTLFRVIKYMNGNTLLQVSPVTGRTHQIRITLSHLGYPIIGDSKYGIPSDLIQRTALHAWRLTIKHPATSKKMTFTADPPVDLKFIGTSDSDI